VERNAIWQSIDVERNALADDLAPVDGSRWSTPSLCAGLTVREVLAHLTVSGAVSGPRWFAGVLRARFDFDQQVDDRLREQLGPRGDVESIPVDDRQSHVTAPSALGAAG